MLKEVISYINKYALLHPEFITFHVEAVKDPIEIINYIKSKNIKAGISIKPNTSIDEIKDYLDLVDLVLVMSVEPGYGGQKYLDSATNKINELKAYNGKFKIEVDGGINDETIKNVNPTIYISSDLAEDSCRYKVALRHEQTHQQINLEVFDYYIPIIQRRFEEAVKRYALISSKRDINLTLAQEKFQDKYLAAVNEVLKEISAEIHNEQLKLDSAENYSYEMSLCR